MNGTMTNERLNRTVQRINAVTTAVTIMFGAIILQVILQIILETMIKILIGESIQTSDFWADVNRIIYGAAGGISAIWLYRIVDIKKPESEYTVESGISGKIRNKFSITRIIIILIFGVAMQGFAYCLLNIAYTFFGTTTLFVNYGKIISKLDGHGSSIIFLYTMFFAPLFEEYIFRGLIFSSARKGFGFMGANILQALLFGIYHGNIVQGMYAFLLGMCLGYVAEYRKGMSEIVLLHIVVNASGIWVVPLGLYAFGQLTGMLPAYMIGLVISVICIAIIIISHYFDKKSVMR